jgi:PAS domain S-box-containing protein
MKIRFVFFTRIMYLWRIVIFFSLVFVSIDADCSSVKKELIHNAVNEFSGDYLPAFHILKSSFFGQVLLGQTGDSSRIVIIISICCMLVCCLVILLLIRNQKKLKGELRTRIAELIVLKGDLKKVNEELVNQNYGIANQIANSERQYEILIESADDGITFYDKDGKLKFANTAFYSLIGVDKLEYEQRSESYYVHPEDIHFIEERKNDLRTKGLHNCEIRLKHKKGHFVPLSIKTVLIKDTNGELMGYLSISRDITSIKNVEIELIKAKVAAETSYKLKSNFLANISHEVRTPLNSVVGFSNLLLAEDITKEAKAEYIGHINHNSEKLLQIIGDIIDLSRLESSQIEISYEETSINDIVTEVIEDARKQIDRNEKPIILNVRKDFKEMSDLIFTDHLWLKRVLNHLMDNAIKFTLEGFVELSYSKDGDNLLFKIKDTGIGINKDNLGNIFEGFQQESNGHQRPFEGLGIGLTLAKEVIERMGGKIFVNSEKGIGSEFSFIIPFRPAGSNRLKTKATVIENQLTDWSTKKCLLVDDNKEVLIYLNRILVDTGIEIITARSGPEAIEIIKNDPSIDVILLDMQMPEMNGIEATKEIRMIRKDLPIIAQTAFVYEHDTDIIIEAGCDACLIKPIRKDHLLAIMSNFIK